MKTALKRIETAQARLVMNPNFAFWGALSLHLRPEHDESEKTMSTDGRGIFYSEEFTQSLPDDELLGVVAHEAGHCALRHHTRRGERDLEDWNRAADYELNPILIQAGLKLPRGGLVNPKFAGLSAESIYTALRAQKSQPQSGQSGKPGANGQQSGAGAPQAGQPSGGQPGNGGKPQDLGNDPGGCGGVRDAAPAHDKAGLAQAAAQWEANVKQALAIGKRAGKIPGALAAMESVVKKPQIDVPALVRRFIDDSTSRDYSWTRPNRRFAWRGTILPTMIPDRPAHIVAMIDSSGSMSVPDVQMLTAELQAALDEGAADRLTVAYADTQVGAHATYEPGDLISIRDVPRGGTSFAQPFQWIAENCPDATAILYLTDADTTSWGEEPNCPVLWIVNGDPRQGRAHVSKAPFGEAVVIGE